MAFRRGISLAVKISSVLVAVAAALLTGVQGPAAEQPAKLSANDVSILFPLPKADDDLSAFISLADLTDASGARLLSDEDFARYVAVAEGPAGKVDGTPARQIAFPTETKDLKAWFVAGIRIDVGAPGLSEDIMNEFGQIPQIRLIAQPVTGDAGHRLVHDRAAHFIFSFVASVEPKQGCLPKFVPNLDAFRPALADFVALRDGLANGRFGDVTVDTSGPLDVHPGLKGASQKPFRDEIKAVLERHLKPAQLSAMAAMGLPASKLEPWIFVAMQKVPVGDGKFALISPPSPALDGVLTAQLVKFGGKVAPKPMADNQNPITRCLRPPAARKGVATADLDGLPTKGQVTDVTGIIADPAQSHFFNTDCVSCHTETRMLRAKVPSATIAGIAEAVLPKNAWNVRNFGWGSEGGARFKPTITRRTATETAEVVKAANDLLPSLTIK